LFDYASKIFLKYEKNNNKYLDDFNDFKVRISELFNIFLNKKYFNDIMEYTIKSLCSY
jgi:hypothetical protein